MCFLYPFQSIWGEVFIKGEKKKHGCKSHQKGQPTMKSFGTECGNAVRKKIVGKPFYFSFVQNTEWNFPQRLGKLSAYSIFIL